MRILIFNLELKNIVKIALIWSYRRVSDGCVSHGLDQEIIEIEIRPGNPGKREPDLNVGSLVLGHVLLNLLPSSCCTKCYWNNNPRSRHVHLDFECTHAKI